MSEFTFTFQVGGGVFTLCIMFLIAWALRGSGR